MSKAKKSSITLLQVMCLDMKQVFKSNKACICHHFTLQSSLLLSGISSFLFASKWTGRHLFSIWSQPRITCCSCTVMSVTCFLSLTSMVKNVSGFLLMQRFPWNIFPPEEHTAITLLASLKGKNDWVGLSQVPILLMKSFHSFFFFSSGTFLFRCCFRKVSYAFWFSPTVHGPRWHREVWSTTIKMIMDDSIFRIWGFLWKIKMSDFTFTAN